MTEATKDEEQLHDEADEIRKETADGAPEVAEHDRIAELEQQLEEAKSKALYAAADTQNVRRRLEQELQQATSYAAAGFARDMLAIKDHLDRALAAVSDDLRADKTAAQFSERSRPKDVDRPVKRACSYNVWRVLTPPPQDIPLALCDARSFGPEDLVESDSIFDVTDGPEWSFESWLVKFNPRHRWVYFSDMDLGDALIFKTNDSDRAYAHNVPHSAFDDPSCPKGVPTRSSIEMRAIGYWFE